MGATSGEFKAPSGSLLDETNALSYLPDKRNAQADYYRLENRERQLAAISSLTPEEASYVLGEAATEANKGEWKTKIIEKVQKIHEKDLIELKALVYLQGLPDTSPELIQLKTYCGCDTREQIAGYIAEKQIKKLFLSQIEAITAGNKDRGGTLAAVYNTTIQRGPKQFESLFK
jgi:hypothetical protein